MASTLNDDVMECSVPTSMHLPEASPETGIRRKAGVEHNFSAWTLIIIFAANNINVDPRICLSQRGLVGSMHAPNLDI